MFQFPEKGKDVCFQTTKFVFIKKGQRSSTLHLIASHHLYKIYAQLTFREIKETMTPAEPNTEEHKENSFHHHDNDFLISKSSTVLVQLEEK